MEWPSLKIELVAITPGVCRHCSSRPTLLRNALDVNRYLSGFESAHFIVEQIRLSGQYILEGLLAVAPLVCCGVASSPN